MRDASGPAGEQILASMPQGRRWAWPMIVRTAVMDEIVMRLVHEEGVDTVLNLAAGLDARPYRLDLPAELRWIDVDLAGILSYKEAELAGEPPRCRMEFVRPISPTTRRGGRSSSVSARRLDAPW